jgi:hypothetical protein
MLAQAASDDGQVTVSQPDRLGVVEQDETAISYPTVACTLNAHRAGAKAVKVGSSLRSRIVSIADVGAITVEQDAPCLLVTLPARGDFRKNILLCWPPVEERYGHR